MSFMPGGPLHDWERRYVKWALITLGAYAILIGFLIWLHTGGF